MKNRKRRKINFFAICRLTAVAAIFFLVIFTGLKLFTGAKWDGERRFTIVFEGDPLLLFSIEPASHRAVVISVPVNTVLEVPFDYGTYPAGAVYRLGNLDTKRNGGKLLSKSMENTFGAVVEGFFAAKSGNKLSFKSDNLADFKKKYFSIPGFLPSIFAFQKVSQNLASDLSFADIVRLWNAVRNLRSDQITAIDLSAANVLSEEKLPDGTTVAIINYDLLDQMDLALFQDQKVREENISIEIVNATKREKVASNFARILRNLGANVISKVTAEQSEKESCKIYASRSELLSSIIADRLTKFYRCKTEEQKNSGISDIRVILGENFLK